jgi:Zn-finger nucleic acid-binding protein
MCSADMKIGYREELRYDFCGVHGLWLDAGEVYRFAEVFKRT